MVYFFFFLRELLNQLRDYGMKITSALPLQFIVGNIVRRILNIIREEYIDARKVTISYV
jgi:translation initiation factor 2B subunit (eIF-2B alpha/beta/delta family)